MSACALCSPLNFSSSAPYLLVNQQILTTLLIIKVGFFIKNVVCELVFVRSLDFRDCALEKLIKGTGYLGRVPKDPYTTSGEVRIFSGGGAQSAQYSTP